MRLGWGGVGGGCQKSTREGEKHVFINILYYVSEKPHIFFKLLHEIFVSVNSVISNINIR